jgi:endonuclease/exonuclease/phosphatase family metal-dependent hydrolase
VTGSAFASTRYATLPSPCPSFADVIAIHEAVLAADHEHSRATPTVSVPVPPAVPKLGEELVTVIWQRDAVGPETFVTAELPHAAARMAAMDANSRARARVTAVANTRPAPECYGEKVKGMRRGIVVTAALAAGVGIRPLFSAPPPPTCASGAGTGVRWIRTAPDRERESLDRWCAAVGPPAHMDARRPQQALSGPFAIVSWNDHVGAGDIDAFVADLRSSRLTNGVRVSGFIILMQEAYRGGAAVPGVRTAAVRWASAEQPPGPDGHRDDIVAAARRLDLSAIYVPSMRNGTPGATDEDRGNAILSTVPLTDVTAIELPLERQRRVAIQTTVTLRGPDGNVAPLRIVDTHFTNMVMHHIWLLSESGRYRQAHALAGVLPPEGALVVGGDFNAWFGFHDAAYRELARGMHGDGEDPRPTFGPMRLDHLLFRLPDGLRETVRRADSRYGSDHYPIVAVIDVVPSPG